MVQSAPIKFIGQWLLRIIVIGSVAWTAFCLFSFLRFHLTDSRTANLVNLSDSVTVMTPKIPEVNTISNLSTIPMLLSDFVDSLGEPVWTSIVFQSDSTWFFELTHISDCGCQPGKINRYTITRTIVDPATGIILTRLSDRDLSAERLNRYFGGLTQIRRFVQ